MDIDYNLLKIGDEVLMHLVAEKGNNANKNVGTQSPQKPAIGVNSRRRGSETMNTPR